MQRLTKLYRQVSSENNLILHPSLVRFLDSSRRQSEALTLFWQYLFARSYEYRTLLQYHRIPLTGRIRDQLLQTIHAAAPNLDVKQMVLDLYSEPLHMDLLDLANSLSRHPRTDTLMPLHFKNDDLFLQTLNSNRTATLSFSTFAEFTDFFPDEEDLRIILRPGQSIQVSVVLDPSYKPQPVSDVLNLVIEHGRYSRIRSDGRMLLFDHKYALTFDD